MAWEDNLHLASICSFFMISYRTSTKTIFTHSLTLNVSLRMNVLQKSFVSILTETVKSSITAIKVLLAAFFCTGHFDYLLEQAQVDLCHTIPILS